MADNHHYESEETNLEVHHEETDVNVRGILWFVAGFVVFSAITAAVVWGVFEVFKSMEKKKTGAPMTMVDGGKRLPPEPRLQPFPPALQEYPGQDRSIIPLTPPVDMARMRETEDRQLTTWSWVDEGKGVVRMPVERGMEIALQRGFPVRTSVVAVPVAADGAVAGSPEAGGDGTLRPVAATTAQPETRVAPPAAGAVQP